MAKIILNFSINKTKDWYPKYYAYVWNRVKNQWYQKNNFLVLDHKESSVPNAVCFPDLPVVKDSLFLESAILNHVDYRKERILPEIDVRTHDEFPFDSISPVDESFICEIQTCLGEFDNNFCKYICDLFNIENESVSIEIFPASFGTQGSFWTDYVNKKLYITIRDDVPSIKYRITKCIIYYFLYLYHEERFHFQPWLHREAIVSFIMNTTWIKNFTEQNDSMDLYKNIVNESKKDLVEQSNKYLRKLGCSLEVMTFIDENKNVYINDVKVEKLSPNSAKLLEYLIQNRDKVCTMDEISDLLYSEKSSEKFSLQYIAKLVEETRNSLVSYGLSRNLITTYRKRGYKFVS